MIEAYPLCWPVDYPRTADKKSSRFKTTLARARDFVKDEIRRINGKDPVISTNIPLKQNGDLYADWQRYKMDDAGAAVYFTRNKNQVVLCCDTYNAVHENLYAIGRTIAALRQIDRDGVSDFLDRTFTGFKALPEKIETPWHQVLQVSVTTDEQTIVRAYRDLAKVHHPDAGGDPVQFDILSKAFKQAMHQFKK